MRIFLAVAAAFVFVNACGAYPLTPADRPVPHPSVLPAPTPPGVAS